MIDTGSAIALTSVRLVKAHAYGNDFLLGEDRLVDPSADRAALARAVCDRHRGIGADGLILFRGSGPITMSLRNADGSYSEVSGNGVRCLAAWIAELSGAEIGDEIQIDTDAGRKRLELLERRGSQMVFRAAMGQPEAVTRTRLNVDAEPIEAITLRVGNPQCVVLGEVTQERLHRLASKLAVHSHFPQGTNVELAQVVSPGEIRILIWERGVGPTEASGTGACAAAVAGIAYGGAARDLSVVAPGGAQRVEWRDDGLYLTGAAEVIAICDWQGSRAPNA